MSVTISRRRGSSVLENVAVHFMERDGKRVYRYWDKTTGEYIGREMTLEEIRDRQLCNLLRRHLDEEICPYERMERDLTGKGWWTSDSTPSSVVEVQTRDGMPSDEDLATQWRCARIATSAIRAYLMALEAGHDPLDFPIISFVDGKFVSSRRTMSTATTSPDIRGSRWVGEVTLRPPTKLHPDSDLKRWDPRWRNCSPQVEVLERIGGLHANGSKNSVVLGSGHRSVRRRTVQPA